MNGEIKDSGACVGQAASERATPRGSVQKEALRGSVLYSTRNPASMNIVTHLKSDWNWKDIGTDHVGFSVCSKPNCCSAYQGFGADEEIIERVPAHPAHYYLYASTHKSASGKPCLTAHFPGNWGAAEMGGNPRTLNTAFGSKLKQILKFLKQGALKEGLDWEVCLEADHHGPTPQGGDQCLIFVEIGPTEAEWKNAAAGKSAAAAVFRSLLMHAPRYDNYLAIGGGHYTPKFTPYALGEKLLDGQEISISHVLAKYNADALDEAMLEQAMRKSIEPIKGALLDWKGLDAAQRGRITELLDKKKVDWIKA